MSSPESPELERGASVDRRPALLSRFSFSTRLILVAVLAALAPLAIAFIVLVDLPTRVADDSVSLELRESASLSMSELRGERAALREELVRRIDEPALRDAIVERDEAALQAQLSTLRPGLEAVFLQRADDYQNAGPISAVVTAEREDRNQTVVVYRQVNDPVVNQFAERVNERVELALVDGGRTLGRSSGFPADLDPAVEVRRRMNGEGEASVRPLEIDGQQRHSYVRAINAEGGAFLVALSTPELERTALAAIREDVLRALAVLLVGSVLFALLGAYAFNRGLRRFAARAKAMAEGKYEARLPVFGNDAFAELSQAFNSLGSELTSTTEQLRAAARWYERTLETIEEGICVWNENGRISYWNRGAEMLTGVSRAYVDDLDEDPVLAFLRDERRAGVRRVSLPVRRSGATPVVDLVVTKMPGGGLLQTFRDSTMSEMLQRTQRNFMATAAHELRTPIATILGFADTLANPEIELGEEQRHEFLELIQEQARHLQRLTDAFFTSHQLANERIEIALESVPLEPVVRDSMRRVELGAGLQGELPEVQVNIAPDVHVYADRRALMGIISALVENAVKYGEPPIEVDAQVQGGGVVLRVRDHGPGIDQMHLERIFDPFYRVDVDMRQGVGGAGLGLYRVHKLVEAMRGNVRVESEPHAATTFCVELPGAPAELGSGSNSLRLVR